MKKESTVTKEIETITAELVSTLRGLGINPTPYSIAIRMTAETLRERQKAYDEYIENGGRQVTDKGRSDPSAVRLAAWNSQARACLSMLKLTPWRVSLTNDMEEESEV